MNIHYPRVGCQGNHAGTTLRTGGNQAPNDLELRPLEDSRQCADERSFSLWGRVRLYQVSNPSRSPTRKPGMDVDARETAQLDATRRRSGVWQVKVE
jgi:hypothetical protein